MPAFRKVEFARGRLDDLKSYLVHELENCIGDRAALEHKWRSQIIQVRARVMGDGTSDIPFIGASDIEMPLSAIHSDPVEADFMQSLHAPKDFWSITGIRPDGVDSAKPLQEFMSLVERRDVKMRQVNKRAIKDLITHGTCIYKDSILHDRKKVQDYNAAGDIESVTRIKFQPLVEPVPLKDFYIPAYAWEIDPDAIGGAPWVSQKYRLTKGQFMARKNSESPWLPPYDKKAAEEVEAWATNLQGQDVVLAAHQQEDEYIPWQIDKIELHEVWVRWDVDGDGVDEDIVVSWHQESRQVLRAVHIPFVHGQRIFSDASYLPGFGFYGLGVAEIDEWAQLAISRLLNETINNASLANTVMLGVPLGSNVMPDEAIYSGKQWHLGPGEKISEVRMGTPYPGMMEIISGLNQWAELRTGVNEMRQGDISSLPSRTPASSVLQLLQEGNKRPDMILSNLRDGALGAIGRRMLQNLIQISKDDPRYIALAMQALGEADGAKVAAVLQGPVGDVESNFGVAVTATSSKVNKEIDKQNLIQLAQYIAQNKPQQLQYAQAMVQMQVAPPQLLAEVLSASFNSSIEFERRLLEAYDVQNPEQYSPAPVVPQQQMMQPGMAPAAGGAPAGAPAAMPAGGPQGAGPLAQGEDTLAALLGL
jgi:hypothetical protein